MPRRSPDAPPRRGRVVEVDPFQLIIEAALREADEVTCTQEVFLEGLKGMRDELETRIQTVEDEVKRHTPKRKG